MPSRLVSSIDLIHRVIEAACAYTISRMGILERIPGNPVGIAYLKVGSATALSALDLPSTSFNNVVGLRAGAARDVEPIVDWYRARGSRARFEIASGDDDGAIAKELTRLGFFQSDLHAALIGEPEPHASAPACGSVELVTSAGDMEDFLTPYVEGWGIPDAVRDQFKANVRRWYGQPGWSLYVARVDERPAATAILFTQAGVGYLADSATDPAFRRRGLHAALLDRRPRDAKAAGVDFVCSGADFLSTGHRNRERIGMRLLFLRAIWTPLV